MAVSGFLETAQSFMDDLWLSAISSASGQTDLKYIIELYNGASKIFEGKVYPEPTNKYMYFNVAPIVRNSFSENFFEFDFSNNYDLNALNYSLNYRIGTDYSGITTLNEVSAAVQVGHLTMLRPKFKNRRYLKTSLFDDRTNKWLTDRKQVSSINQNSDKFYIGYNVDADSPSDETTAIKWQSYNEAGTQISSSSYVDIEAGDLAPHRILNIGPDGLDDLTGSSPDITTCAYYIVTLRWYNPEISAYQYITFRINKACNPKYQSVPIHFYNRFLSVDTMRFDLVSRTTVDVERKSYNQRDYRFSGSSVLYTDSSASGTTVYRENKINYNATYNYTMKLTSDFLDDQDWEWLEDLIESPKIYMEEDGYFYPVTIKATNYEISKYINNRLRPLEIEIEFNSPRLSSAR
jgi:hypothetical protein